MSVVCHHHLLSNIIAELEQLRKGLNTLNFLTLIGEFPKKFMSIFAPSDVPLSSEQLEDTLKIKYAEKGSNQRTTVGRIVLHFFNFLHNIEEGKLSQENALSLHDVLMCVTGCSEIPPMGFQETHSDIIIYFITYSPFFDMCSRSSASFKPA